MPPLCSQTMEFWEYCFSECPLFRNHGILGVLFFRMPPVWKPWNFGSTVFQNAPCSETMEFWEYCFSECSLFGNHGILGVLFFRMPPVWKPWHSGSTIFQNAPCSEIMASWENCKWKPAKLGYNVKIPPFSSGLFRRCRPRASKICSRAVRKGPSEKGGILAQNNLF